MKVLLICPTYRLLKYISEVKVDVSYRRYKWVLNKLICIKINLKISMITSLMPFLTNPVK